MKPKEEAKPIDDKPNNQSRAAIIFIELFNKKKYLMKELHVSVDYRNLNFEYIDKKNNDVSFYAFKNSRELFDPTKVNQIKFDESIKKQNEFLNKLNIIKVGGKNSEQKKVSNNFEKFYLSREEITNFFRNYGKIVLDAA